MLLKKLFFTFLLLFGAVTIYTQHVAMNAPGVPSLSDADLLHGGSEAFLSISNLMIALGALVQLRRWSSAKLPSARRTAAAVRG